MREVVHACVCVCVRVCACVCVCVCVTACHGVSQRWATLTLRVMSPLPPVVVVVRGAACMGRGRLKHSCCGGLRWARGAREREGAVTDGGGGGEGKQPHGRVGVRVARWVGGVARWMLQLVNSWLLSVACT